MLAACQQDATDASPMATDAGATGAPTDPATTPLAMPSADATASVAGAAGGIAAELDMGALQERRDPERLLRFYTNAIRIGDWDAAARAWTLDAVMTPDKLRQRFGGDDASPKIAVGKGDSATAAGSAYYQVPVTVDFPDGRPSQRGTIVLRRVNDAPGASEVQLLWRIERSSLGAS